MKKIYAIIILFLTLLSCNQTKRESESISQKEKTTPEVSARLIRSYDTTSFYADTLNYKTFDIELSIINKSTNTVSFWMMYCSWEENFIINNDYINFIGHECDKNGPTAINLKHNDSLVLRAQFYKRNSSLHRTIETTKFGLIYIDKTVCKSTFDYESIIGDKSKYQKIIWSNPLYLQDLK